METESHTDVVIEPIQPEGFTEALNVLGKAFATLSSSHAIYEGRAQSDIERLMEITFRVLLKNLPGQVFAA
ncbi:hypothetical protein ACFLTP_08965 [Chloroflexota bacterium]